MTDAEPNRLERSIEVKIPFHDTDAAGLVWHGHYFKYFELARCELLDAIDYGYNEMKISGFVWPVVDLKARYISSLKFDQRITITAQLHEWEYRLRIHYEIHDDQRQLVSRGHTDQAPVVEATGELQIGCPQVLRERVEIALSNEARDQNSQV